MTEMMSWITPVVINKYRLQTYCWLADSVDSSNGEDDLLDDDVRLSSETFRNLSSIVYSAIADFNTESVCRVSALLRLLMLTMQHCRDEMKEFLVSNYIYQHVFFAKIGSLYDIRPDII